uniref:Uncharacterized protein n=1 Tax=Anguilla anguilla TaxID=7936 RepID=A0A0E9SK37_ANGAN
METNITRCNFISTDLLYIFKTMQLHYINTCMWKHCRSLLTQHGTNHLK